MKNRAAVSWCLYDLANTIFAINMTSYHFPVWVISDRGGLELHYSLAFGISMLASALLMPWLGRRSDRLGGKVRGMVVWTLGCVLLTGSLSWIPSLVPALVVFAFANFCYQVAGVFYNALLPAVAPEGSVGRVSGYGVALGYVGTLIAILATAPIAARWGRQATFFPTGLLFLLLALPSFFWVEEKKVVLSVQSDGAVLRILRPLVPSAFLGLSVVGTAILFMSVYAKQAIGMDDRMLQRFLTVATVVTIIGSFAWGKVTDRLGGYRALGWVWALWVLVFTLASCSFDPKFFVVVGSLSGVALGGTWVASRVLLVELVGPERVGEAFGLFGLISRLSAVAGPVAWAFLLWLATPLGHERYRLAMLSLVAVSFLSWWMYRRLGKDKAFVFGRIAPRG